MVCANGRSIMKPERKFCRAYFRHCDARGCRELPAKFEFRACAVWLNRSGSRETRVGTVVMVLSCVAVAVNKVDAHRWTPEQFFGSGSVVDSGAQTRVSTVDDGLLVSRRGRDWKRRLAFLEGSCSQRSAGHAGVC